MKKPKFSISIVVFICLGLASSLAYAQKPARKNFGKGNPFTVKELPAGKLKSKLERLSPTARGKAMKWLHTFTFPEMDAVESLQVDKEGGVYYECAFSCVSCKTGEHDKSVHYENPVEKSGAPEAQSTEPTTEEKSSVPEVAAAAVLISSPPVYNSKPGAPNHMYLDFNGGVITGKAWNTSRGVSSWTAKAFSLDADLANFSDAEQTFMRRVWERIAEDYAPFNINITTDVAYDPATTGGLNNVAWNLFCPRVDANSVNLPHAGSGGVAYVGVFGNSNFASTYQPAFTKAETNESADIAAEAGSHEVGHNMGLSHDTRSNEGYYGGHNATALAASWGPIMGTGYNRNMSQWSKGEYYDSKHASWNPNTGSYDNNANTNDDLLIISNRTGYRTDEHGGTNATATALTLSGSGGINQTGVIQNTNEVDVLSFATGAGSITINANPFKSDTSTWGGNLDINLELYNSAGTLVASHNPNTDVTATITTTVAAGTYYIHIKPSAAGNASGTGSPYDSVDSTRGGYTVYGSLGQYTITGSAILPGVNITEVGGTNVTEGGATDTYTIKLGTAPTANVTVSISPNAQVTTSVSSVTFTTTDWNTPKIVTVTAFNDSLIEGDHTGIITHAATSSDANFNGVSIGSAIVNITDNDNIILTAPNGGENWMASSTQTITWTSLMGGNVKLELLKNGSLDSTIIASTPNDGTHSWTIPTGQLPAADYKVRISSVETPASTDTSFTNFIVTPIPSIIFSQNFDAASTFPTNWSNTTVSGTASWAISTTKSQTPTRSAFIVGSAIVSSNQLTSAAMAIPSGTTSIQFSFYHDYILETNWDGGLLEFSIDGGAWFDVISSGSGASFAQNGYNLGSVPSNYQNPIGGRAAWSGNSGGFVKTIVDLTDTAKYAGKSLRARWVTGTDNAQSSAGWYVDTVSLTGILSSSVTYNANGSDGGSVPVDNNNYVFGAPVTVANNTGSLVKSGSTFAGWNTAVNGLGTTYAPATSFNVYTNTTLYAKWTITLTNWAASNSLIGGNAASGANPDGDSLNNIQEYAFGMNPNSSATPSLAFNVGGEVTQAGVPVLRYASSKYHAVFARRKDHVAAGLTYTAEFSADLNVWTSSAAGLSVLTVAGPSELEAVSIEFPATVPIQGSVTQQPPKFFRVGVE